MDDYFYTGSDFNDAASFAAYGGDFVDIGGWCRNNVNQLVESLYNTVHQIKSDAEFGIRLGSI